MSSLPADRLAASEPAPDVLVSPAELLVVTSPASIWVESEWVEVLCSVLASMVEQRLC